MTDKSLQKGLDLQNEIQELKNALSASNRAQIFKDTHPCSGEPNDFLVTLHSELKLLAASRIRERIQDLEIEFQSL